MTPHDIALIFAFASATAAVILARRAMRLEMEARRKPSRVRILSGAHANHFGDLIRRDRRRAMVRLRTGVCVWVEDVEWVRVSP